MDKFTIGLNLLFNPHQESHLHSHNIASNFKQRKKRSLHLPTAGDIDLEPDEPVGDGVGLMPCCEFGVPGAAVEFPAPPLELSLLF